MPSEKTAAEMMLDLLVDRWGVRHVFGLAGDGINGIIEALRKRKSDVQFVGVRLPRVGEAVESRREGEPEESLDAQREGAPERP